MIEIQPFQGRLSASVSIPGSKYLANRALFLAALARGDSKLLNVPINDDIATAIAGLRQFGVGIFRQGSSVTVRGLGGKPAFPTSPIHTSDSGTFARFIISLGSLLSGETAYFGSPKMNSRPMKDLLIALNNLGVWTKHTDFRMPLQIKGSLKGGKTHLNASVSSQYLSSLLISAPYAKNPTFIEMEGKMISKPYIAMTIKMMRDFDVWVDNYDFRRFVIRSGQCYRGREFAIESDPVSSSYFLGAAALLGGEITIPHFNINSLQGESQFVKVLKKMGCELINRSDAISLRGPRQLKAVEVDMGNMPDVVQTLAVLAAFAKGTTLIKNIAHLKHKESDRISDTAKELRKLNIEVAETEDSLQIKGGRAGGAVIETHQDHRMAMSFALVGLKTPGVKIKHPEVVGKSFPSFWETLQKLGVQIKINN